VAYQLTLIRGRIEQQRGDLGFGQLLSSPLMPSRYPEAGRSADPAEEVDQGAALETEGAADRRLDGAAISGSGQKRSQIPLSDAPDAARKAARVRGLSGT